MKKTATISFITSVVFTIAFIATWLLAFNGESTSLSGVLERHGLLFNITGIGMLISQLVCIGAVIGVIYQYLGRLRAFRSYSAEGLN